VFNSFLRSASSSHFEAASLLCLSIDADNEDKFLNETERLRKTEQERERKREIKGDRAREERERHTAIEREIDR
jgi:hypothetical protein